MCSRPAAGPTRSVEARFHVHVDVLEGPREGEGAALDLALNRLQAAFDGGDVGGGQDAGGAEHGDMRQ